MNIKNIIIEWLKSNKYDGLCNIDIPCGCLIEDLLPCGETGDNCEAGVRVDIDKNTPCSCDGNGTDHWHVCDPKFAVKNLKTLKNELLNAENLLLDAENWLCECGKRCNPSEAEWRWNGRAWEHHHGYPIGHVEAVRCPNK